MNDKNCDEDDCFKVTALVNRYIDNLLDDNEITFVQNHLANCPGCNHGYEFESLFHMRVKSLTPIHMPEEIKSSIMLSMGFPGMSEPMKGSFSPFGSRDAVIDKEISSQMGIPKGEIPRGEIPKSPFFSDSSETSLDNKDDVD
ncbi:MAG: zf-HC2 domain-containing protein [Acidimicrobiia bacterium]